MDLNRTSLAFGEVRRRTTDDPCHAGFPEAFAAGSASVGRRNTFRTTQVVKSISVTAPALPPLTSSPAAPVRRLLDEPGWCTADDGRLAVKYSAVPISQGLYDPAFERDSCGVAAVADIKGRR
ncbi:MAG: hypothetical protein ACR2M5_10725, partial [Nakamurella sp.]